MPKGHLSSSSSAPFRLEFPFCFETQDFPFPSSLTLYLKIFSGHFFSLTFLCNFNRRNACLGSLHQIWETQRSSLKHGAQNTLTKLKVEVTPQKLLNPGINHPFVRAGMGSENFFYPCDTTKKKKKAINFSPLSGN